MNAVSVLKSRNKPTPIIDAFVQRTLQDEANRLETAQDRVLSTSADEVINHIKRLRNTRVAGNRLIQKHAIQQRFIDMKRTRRGRQTPIKTHNQPIYRSWNSVLFRLRYDLTEALRGQLLDKIVIPV